jgi:hypothetical protein
LTQINRLFAKEDPLRMANAERRFALAEMACAGDLKGLGIKPTGGKLILCASTMARRGAADCGEYCEAAGAVAETLSEKRRDLPLSGSRRSPLTFAPPC